MSLLDSTSTSTSDDAQDRFPVSILGAGAWGTALAMALADRNDVLLWGRDPDLMREIASSRINKAYLPDFELPANLILGADLDEAVAHVTGAVPGLLVVASSLAGLRPLAERLKAYPVPNLVWLCKGLEGGTQLLPHQVVSEVLGAGVPHGALSGPSFAQEVARGLPCALTIASETPALQEMVVHAVHGPSLRVYKTDDLVGVELGGATKNILAIATGVADGMGLGLNARAALITRGLAEMTRLGLALGGRIETFMGLAGVGDLILTCTGDLSRNRQVGLGLAAGKKLDQIVAELGHVAEGVRCAQAVRALALDHGVDMPITNAIAAVLFDGDTPEEMVHRLLARDPREEGE